MTVGLADLAQAINAVWDASTLDAAFRALWSDPVDAEFPVLHDTLGGGGQRFPFCIMEMPAGLTTTRMSKGKIDIWETRDLPVTFRIHAREVSGDARTAKKIAADLAEEILEVFGGHPTVTPTPLVLDNGNFLICQYDNDFGIRSDDDVYLWTVNYLIRLDVPVVV